MFSYIFIHVLKIVLSFMVNSSVVQSVYRLICVRSFIAWFTKVRFGTGYSTRRINLTFLYGLPNDTCEKAALWKKGGKLVREVSEREKLKS